MKNPDYYVEMAANGDRTAFEEVYKQTYYMVYYTCFNLLKNEQDALDVTQDVFVTVMNLLDLWYNKGTMIIKTADGYYSCIPEEDTTLVPDELFNSLTADVIDIYGRYILLSDGFVYELP